MFYRRNVGRGAKRTAAAVAVRSNTLWRRPQARRVVVQPATTQRRTNPPQVRRRAPANQGVALSNARTFKPRPARVSQSSDDGCIVTGNDYLTTVVVNTTTNVGSVLTAFNINPSTIPNARLAAIASTYELFRVEYIEFHYMNSINTTITGQMVMYVDPDPADAPNNVSGTSQIQKAMSAKNSKTFAIFKDAVVRYTPDRKLTDMYISPGVDPRFASYGTFVLASNTTGYTGPLTCGTLMMRYKIAFKKPLIETTPSFYNVQAWNSGIPTAANFTNAMTPTSGSFGGATVVPNGFLINAPGYYLILTAMSGTVLTGTFQMAGGAGYTIVTNMSVIAAALTAVTFAAVVFVSSSTTTLSYNTTGITLTGGSNGRAWLIPITANLFKPATQVSRLDKIEKLLSRLNIDTDQLIDEEDELVTQPRRTPLRRLRSLSKEPAE